MAAATRARNLVRQLLAFGRNQVLSLDVVDLGEIVVGFEPLLHRATREDIRIVVEREERPVWVRADVTQMEQVLLNLAVNARDAMPNEGTLRLAVAASEDHAIASLVVADTGIGMSPEIREHIFEPFFTTKEQGLGHGLGLATVFGIVTQHGGRITVDSEPGIGSRFVVSLPCAAAPQRRLPTPSVTAPGGRHDSASILVVEDDPAMLRLVVTMITQLGYTHFTAPGADAAVAIAGDRSNDFDLLLSDIIMPGCNGPDLYARLRIDRPSLRVLYMSGYNEDVLPLEDSTRKRPSILQKPFSLDALSKAILEALVRDS
ncbi:MAG TPA: ATP-binding protein, partial [Desulfobacterales bacterium]|nr:ATP-binding protein [Desulfobacterales bacterium]